MCIKSWIRKTVWTNSNCEHSNFIGPTTTTELMYLSRIPTQLQSTNTVVAHPETERLALLRKQERERQPVTAKARVKVHYDEEIPFNQENNSDFGRWLTMGPFRTFKNQGYEPPTEGDILEYDHKLVKMLEAERNARIDHFHRRTVRAPLEHLPGAGGVRIMVP